MRAGTVVHCLALACGALPAGQLAHAQTAASPIEVGVPSGFAELAQAQQAVVDVIFGGRTIGQFEVEANGAKVRFIDPAAVAAAVPGLIDPAAFAQALTGELDGNARYVCSSETAPCERPKPEAVVVAFDASHFRIELFVNPKLLAVQSTGDEFLKPQTGTPSLVNTIGLAVSGNGDGSPTYSLRNRAIIGVGEARIVSETFLSSRRGGDIDTLVAQLDRPNRRYSAGLFYSPGADLVGRRRLVGLGVSSQFDTHYDRSRLMGTPLVVFLAQRAHVDIFVEGRLVSSSTFEAGNQMLDTTNLPDGSYPIDIRVTEPGGSSRTETRFFTKNGALAPIGHIAFFANAGVLATDRRDNWLSLSKTGLISAGAAGRVGSHFAWDVAAMATERTRLLEIGGTVLSSIGQARLAVLGANGGSYGVVMQAGSTSASRLSFNFDLRKVHSGNSRGLVPLEDFTSDIASVDDIVAQRIQASGVSYLQAAGTVAYRLGPAQLAVSGLYRSDRVNGRTYAIGPSVQLPIIQNQNMRITLDGNYLATDRGRSYAFGVRFQLLGRRSTVSAQAGLQYDGRRTNKRLSELAELTASVQRDDVLGGEATASATLQRANDATLAQVAGDYRGPIGYASASLLQRFSADSGGTQYALNLQTAVAITGNALRIGAKDQNDSVIMVDLEGTARDTPFEVFVDGASRGTIRSGEHLTLALTPYRRYSVRMRPRGADLVAYDAGERKIDVFPGTVARITWKADTVLAMFGRLVLADGTPIANADIVTGDASGDAISATDDNGYFQIQAPARTVLKVRRAGGARCSAAIDAAPSPMGYTALGDILCKS